MGGAEGRGSGENVALIGFVGRRKTSLRNRILARAQARCGASVKIKIGDWGELELAVLAHVVIGRGSPFNRSET